MCFSTRPAIFRRDQWSGSFDDAKSELLEARFLEVLRQLTEYREQGIVAEIGFPGVEVDRLVPLALQVGLPALSAGTSCPFPIDRER